MSMILEAKNIQHDFGGLNVLEGVDLLVKKGERHAILGPNGAGKTTLFNLITGRYKPSSGKIFIDKKNVTQSSIHQRAREGLVRSFQITNIFPTPLRPIKATISPSSTCNLISLSILLLP